MSDVWKKAIVKANKPHRCNLCGWTIPKGSHYIRINYVYDGSAGTYKLHDECRDLYDKCYDPDVEADEQAAPVAWQVRDFFYDRNREIEWIDHIEKISEKYEKWQNQEQ